MQRMKGQIVELDICELAFGGAGIGKHEGMAVFVEGAMPGDKVRASFRRIKSNFAEAELVEIIKPSKNRCRCRCQHADKCGGCQLQFMAYEKQLEFKKQQVIDAFERIGKIPDPPVKQIIGAEDQFYYRNKMEFSFGYDAEMNFALGLHVPGRRYDIMDINECMLQSEFSTKIVNAVRELCIQKSWAPRKYSTNEGFLKSLVIREGKRTGEVMVNLVTAGEVPENFAEELEANVDAIRRAGGESEGGGVGKKIVSVYWSKIISRRGIPKRIEETLIYGKKYFSERMILENGDEMQFDILPSAFFQVNTKQAEKLYSQVVDMAGEKSHETVFDLFCGTGTIGLFLAKHCGQVFGIEKEEAAVRAANENARNNKIFNIDFFTGDVNKALKSLKERPGLVVIDPPRAGITEKIIKQINDFGPSQVIYVSCNPSTLARDCAFFKEYGYNVKIVQPVDMFPHTYHIENVCLLERQL
ncbi:MAG: 23S rRNA (uracil(1939)-C(5))-methyltransferase RlmD [Candidatus Peregrinibacteria bacterium]